MVKTEQGMGWSGRQLEQRTWDIKSSVFGVDSLRSVGPSSGKICELRSLERSQR